MVVRIGQDYIQWALLYVASLLSPHIQIQNDKSSTPGLKSNTPTPRNDAPTPGTSTTPGLRPILGKPPMEALGKYSLYTHSEPLL